MAAPETQYRTRKRVKEEEEEVEEEEMSGGVGIGGGEETWEKKMKKGEEVKRRRRVVQRWSEERLRAAEQCLFDVLVAEGATFESPMARSALRAAARERIGDTGLLDHLLKHVQGKAGPGGTHRFQRWYNSEGVIEYWLESADLASPKRFNNPHFQHNLNHQVRDMFKEMVRWNAQTDQNLQLILASWKSMQDMYEGLMTWRAKVEQQIAEIKSTLESKQQQQQQQQQQHPESAPQQQGSERWEDWLDEDAGGTDAVLPWFGSTSLNTNINTEPVAAVAVVGEHANDSSSPAFSFPCEEQILELFNSKAKMEQKMAKISESLDLISKGQE